MEYINRITLFLNRYPYLVYILLFLSVGWLVYTILSAIGQMDFGHGITDLYDQSGKKRKPKAIKADFKAPILAVVTCVVIIIFVLM